MPKYIIGLGKCSKFYFYILGNIICNAIIIYILKYNLIFNHCPLVQQLFIFFGFVFYGTIFYFIMNIYINKRYKNEDNNIIIKKTRTKSNQLIYNNILKLSKKNIFSFFVVCLFYAINLLSLTIFSYFYLTKLLIWTANLAFVLLFLNHYFPRNLYKHQIISMIFAIVLCTILTIISTFLKYKNKNIYQEKGIKVCLGTIFIFIFLSLINSFSHVKLKVLMDFNYLSPYLIPISIGAIGLFISIIISILFGVSGYKCENKFKHSIKCVGDVLSFFKEKKNLLKNNGKKFYLDIFLSMPLFLLLEFINLIFVILIIQYLNPIFVLFSDNVYYLINNIIEFALGSDFKKFLFLESMQIIEFLAFCIYLELVELRFCGLNQNTRKSIDLRAQTDSIESEEDFLNISDIVYDEERNNIENGKDNIKLELAE